MKHSALSRVAVPLASLALIVAAAHAQNRFALQAPTVLQRAPITLQAGQSAPQAPKAGSAFALADPGPIGLATTTNLFSQVALGGGYTTVFTFVNTGVDTTTGNLILTADNGQPMVANLVSTTSSLGTSTAPLTVPAGGTQLVTASPTNPADPNITSGWARVESSGGNLAGVATFQLSSGNALSTVAGVLSATATSTASIPVDDDGTLGAQSRHTGYAVANAGTTPVNIKIVLVNPDGTINQSFSPPRLNPLAPGAHLATFLWQDLNNQSLKFTGSMVLIEQTGQSFSVVALLLNQSLLTVIPVVPGKAPNIN